LASEAAMPTPQGRVVLVTGAGAGMGRAFAHRFARAGDRMAVFELDHEAADSVSREVRALGAEALPLVGDVADEARVASAFDEVIRQWGRIDVLINNAGIACSVPTCELTAQAWQRTLDINQTGVFLFSRELARRHQHGDAVIVNVVSMYGEVAAPERLAYCASKSAVAMMTRVLAIEWASRGIRVNGIAPGYIETPFLEALADDGRVDLERIRARTPQRRLGTAEEMADLVFFIASPETGFMTGQVVTSDGGWTAYGYY